MKTEEEKQVILKLSAKENIDINKISFQILTCTRCGYKWNPRRVPVQCPKCKSYYWNEDKDFDRRRKEFQTAEHPIIKNIHIPNIQINLKTGQKCQV